MAESDINDLYDEVLNSETSEDLKDAIKDIRNGSDSITLPKELIVDGADGDGGNMFAIIQDLDMPNKLKLAMLGNKMARSILIRDTNKQISRFVLRNARITEDEIIDFARSTELDDSVYRDIARNRQWTKSYALKLAFVSNPRAPQNLSIAWVKFLQDKHLRQLSRSKNIPQLIAGQCRKTLERRKK